MVYVAYGNGKIVAVGSNCYIATFTDGNNWTTPKQLMNDGNAWYAVAYGNRKFIVVGCGTYNGGGYIITLDDGLNWSSPEQLDATNTLYGVCAI